MRSPGGGELSLSACPGVGNRPPSKKKSANPRGCARGGMVIGRIEPCISKIENTSFFRTFGAVFFMRPFYSSEFVNCLSSFYERDYCFIFCARCVKVLPSLQ